MSTVERNKGSLVEIGTVEEFRGDMDEYQFYDFMETRGLLAVGGKLYSVVWEVESEEDSNYFVDVRKDALGVYHFHTLHYNGAASLEEVLEGYLK